MTLSQTIPLSPRAKEVGDRKFRETYKNYMKKARETILIILVWGPAESESDLYRKRLQIRDELRRLGHDALFSEELEESVPSDLSKASQKTIEHLQADTADLVAVMMTSPGSIAEVHDFASFPFIAKKMLVFIDERYTSGYSYQGALTDMNKKYDNVKTYKYPEDIVQCHLLNQVLDKIKEIQLEAAYADELHRISPRRPLQPRPYNLLEFYREHRDELNVLKDEASTFILAFMNDIGQLSYEELAGDVGLPDDELRAKVELLERGKLLIEQAGALVVTATGIRFLQAVGFPAILPLPPTKPPPKSPPPHHTLVPHGKVFASMAHTLGPHGGALLASMAAAAATTITVSVLIVGAFIYSQSRMPSLQGTWLWGKEKVVFTQQGTKLNGRGFDPNDGTVYDLFEGDVSEDGKVSLKAFWNLKNGVPPPGYVLCSDAATAQFIREHEDASHPGYVPEVMNLKYDARTKELNGSYTSWSITCDSNNTKVISVTQPRLDVTFTRATGP